MNDMYDEVYPLWWPDCFFFLYSCPFTLLFIMMYYFFSKHISDCGGRKVTYVSTKLYTKVLKYGDFPVFMYLHNRSGHPVCLAVTNVLYS